MEDEIPNAITFTTAVMLPSFIEESRKLEHFDLFVNKKYPTIPMITIFLNEIDLIPTENRPYIDNNTYQTFNFMRPQNPKHKLSIVITGNVSVHISRAFAEEVFTKNTIMMASNLGKGMKKLKKMHFREHIYFEYTIQNFSTTSKCLWIHSPLIYYSKEEFSKAFRYFAKRFIVRNSDTETESIEAYKECFINDKKFTINSINTLSQNLTGYLTLNIQQSNVRKRLEQVTYNGETYYVVSGVYVSPCSYSILRENDGLVQGFLLDTTWKVMTKYVTSILMASCHNTGVGLGFSFGRAEDREIYQNVFEEIAKITEFDFHSQVIESDQGSALRSVCDMFNMTHLSCLRHLLVSIKYTEFSFFVGLLIRAVSDDDLERAKRFTVENASKITDERRLKQLQRVLQKIGIIYRDNELHLVDEERWRRVSMNHRVTYKMPSTTNALECTHGHLNKKVPRNNNFYRSIFRIAKNIQEKTGNITIAIKSNYSASKRKTLQTVANKPRETMQLEIAYFGTERDRCSCSENRLISSMLNIDFPCSHRVFLGAPIPSCPKIQPSIRPSTQKLVISYNVLPPDNTTVQLPPDEYDKQYAVDTICRFSHYSNKDLIRKFVNENYLPAGEGAEFLLSKPVSLLQVIANGIVDFTARKQKEKSESTEVSQDE